MKYSWVHQRHASHWFGLVKQNWLNTNNSPCSWLIIVIWRHIEIHTPRTEISTGWNLTSENNRPLLCLNSTVLLHGGFSGVVMSKHNAQCSAEMHHLSGWLPQLSCLPSPALIQPSHAPPHFLDWVHGCMWKTQRNEGMDCAANGSCCVIFTFPGSSPRVFHYNNSLATSDKTDDVAIWRDDFPPTLLYLALFLFACWL